MVACSSISTTEAPPTSGHQPVAQPVRQAVERAVGCRATAGLAHRRPFGPAARPVLEVVAEGWREHRRDGGLVIDIATGETVARGLSMPHSPRLHRGRLWLVQSGTGEFGHLDLATGRFEPACFLQGYARGLAFVGDHAVIGVSRPRENRTFEGLALNEHLAREGVGPLCYLAVVNLATGDFEHRLTIEGVVEELYDVAVLPGVIRPSVVGFRTDEIRFLVRPAGPRARAVVD